VLIPLREREALQSYGEAARQYYNNIHSITVDIPIFGPPRARKDRLYQGSVALTQEFHKHTKPVLQFIAMENDSNVVPFH
jgi:hypothetical protein